MIRNLIPDNFRKIASDDRKREVFLSPAQPRTRRFYVYAFMRGAVRMKHYLGFDTREDRAQFVTTFLAGSAP